MNLGLDFHDTISYNPNFFIKFIKSWDGEVYIITGTPHSKKNETIEQLNELGIHSNMYTDILMGFEYDKNKMTVEHFNKMKVHKLNHLLSHNIKVYFDDNPFYVEYLRNFGISVFQTILSDNYLDEFEKKDKFFTSNLQRDQFLHIK